MSRTVPRAPTLRGTRGLLKAVVERGGERIICRHHPATSGSEVAAVNQTAVVGNLPAPALHYAMLANATMAQGLNALFASWVD